MAKVTRDDILYLAQLARLELSEEEIEQFQGELAAILGYVEQLQAVDTSGLEATTQVTGLTNVMRDDVVVSYPATKETLLKLAPHTDADGYLKVKRMVS